MSISGIAPAPAPKKKETEEEVGSFGDQVRCDSTSGNDRRSEKPRRYCFFGARTRLLTGTPARCYP